MDKLILGIETSCDETSAAIVADGQKVLSNVIYSQIDIHKQYGGVVPEIASRSHIEKIDEVVKAAFSEADVAMSDIDAVAVTNRPGLIGALLVGLSYGKALAYGLNKPLVGVHHIEGHIAANYLGENSFEPPFICLIVSGGHTNLVHVHDYGSYQLLAHTRDDAAGEAFDKVARALGMPYPGGVQIDRASRLGNAEAIAFPRAKIKDSLDFSFSGLKSAVLNHINISKLKGEELNINDIAASFQQSVVDVLVEHSIEACKLHGIKRLALAGGVASNSHLRESLMTACRQNDITLNIPDPVFCTDNAAMIAACGYHDYLNGKIASLDLNAYPSGSLW